MPSLIYSLINSDGGEVRTLILPYPRAGLYYVNLTPTCYYQEHEWDEIEMIAVQCWANSTTSVLIDIQSSACLDGKCGVHGKCLQYLSGGILFSTCACRGGTVVLLFFSIILLNNFFSGWRGWLCNDGTQAPKNEQLMLNFLLLVVSNVMFVPAIILATLRRHYSEALVYLLTMTASSVCYPILCE